MIVRSFFMGVFGALFLLAGLLPVGTAAQTGPNFRLVSQQALPGSGEVKFPDISAKNRLVGVSGGANRSVARGWLKADDELTFGNPVDVGDAFGQPDYINTSINVRSDGTVTYAWIANAVDGPIRVRQRFPNGTATDYVNAQPSTRGRLYFYVDVASNNLGTTLIAWNEDARFRYSVSTGGNLGSWSPRGTVMDVESLGRPMFAVGPNNEIAIAIGGSNGDIYAGFWNGAGFDMETVAATSNYEADPTISFRPDGGLVVAWRRVEGGFFYAERQPNGTWPGSRIIDMTLTGPANISVDEGGNYSFAWISEGALYASYMTAAGVTAGPVTLSTGGDSFFNAALASNLSTLSLIHVVVERFSGSGLRTEYYLLSAQGEGLMSAQPVIERGAARFRAVPNLQVTFTDIAGTPTEMRYNWNAPPTDANPWIPYAASFQVPVPTSLNTIDCAPEVLYTQVRNTALTEEQPKQTSIVLDSAVGAAVRVNNPYHPINPSIFPSDEAELLDVGSGGAFGGALNYTRFPQFYLEISGVAECSELKDFRIARSRQALIDNPDQFRAVPITRDPHDQLVTISPTPSNGELGFFIQVTDGVGNSVIEERKIIYDNVAPVLVSGQLSAIQPNPEATIVSTLVFSDVTVTDNLYPDGYWGVWVANSLKATNPLTDSTLIWTPVELKPAWRGGAGSPTILPNWSLATGLRDPATNRVLSLQELRNLEDVTIHVYVRFLDGAGNPTAVPTGVTQVNEGWRTQSVTLEQVTLPEVLLPIVPR